MPEITQNVDINTDVDIEVEVYCSCGEGLCGQSEAGKSGRSGTPYIQVEPCKKCLSAARDEGYDEGYEKGEESNE